MAVGQFIELQPVQFETMQDRVGGRLLQVGDQLLVAFIGEGAHIDVEILGKGEQDPGGDRPLIALKQVEIAGRDAERLGCIGLGEAALAAQTPQARTGKQLFKGAGVFSHVSIFTKRQIDNVNTIHAIRFI